MFYPWCRCRSNESTLVYQACFKYTTVKTKRRRRKSLLRLETNKNACKILAQSSFNSRHFAARKEHNAITQMIAALPDSFTSWIECYMNLTVIGLRNDEIADKIILHLSRFRTSLQH